MSDDICGSEPPPFLIGVDGSKWVAGDCWCTLAPGHQGDCVCEICRKRYGMPGWRREGG
jgi:hypothetical protein